MQPRQTRTGALLALAFVVALLGFGLAALTQGRASDPVAFGPAFVLVTLLVALVQAFPLELPLRRESTNLVISELPLALGLFVLGPLELVTARLFGLLVFEVARHRGFLIKIVVTSAIFVLETGIAVATFWWVLGLADLPENTPAALLAALIGVVVATTMGGVVTWVAVGLASGGIDPAVGLEMQRVMLPITLVNTSISLVALVVIREQPAAAWLLVIPIVVVMLGYRRYLTERNDRQFMAAMYELARDIHQARDVPAAFEVFARTLREHIGATRLELYLQRAGGNQWGLVAQGDGSISELQRVERIPLPAARSLSEGEPVLEHDDRGRCTSVSYALDLGDERHLAFVARDPASDVAGFQANAAHVLTAVGSHARAVLEDVELQEAKSSFLSNVSHELRTPLSVVLGAAETLHQQRGRLSPDVAELLTTRLHAQAARLDGLLSNLLDVDRLGRGLLEPNWSHTDLGALIQTCVHTLGIETHEVQVHAESIRTAVDPAACERIVENLVFNAAKYTPPGSTITVRVREQEPHAFITVEDEGSGIADPDKVRVFQPFVRLDPNHHSPGTGIGLSLVERLVRMQGGHVEVQDAAGGGARFSVRLPLRRPAPQPELGPLPGEPRATVGAPRGPRSGVVRRPAAG